jgi:dUTP pyrophosphatase
MIDLRIKILDDDSNLYPFYNDWDPNHDGDSGLDLYCPDQIIIKSGETHLIKMGIACEMTDEYLPISYMLVPRSSISKTPLRMANSIGIIDAGYRGEIMAAVDNRGDKDYMIVSGQRLFQIVHPTLCPFNVGVVDELSETDRGMGGFGSTGK